MLSPCATLARGFASKLGINLLGARVLIDLDESNKEKIGSLYVPETAQKSTNRGKILAVGPGHVHPESGKFIPNSLKVGQTVLLPEFGGQKVKLQNKEYTILEEDMIIATLD